MDVFANAIVNSPLFLPHHGWHDDHRHLDRTPEYRPAIQQNRAEFVAFINLLQERGLKVKCLQLGLGYPGGSHAIFAAIFAETWSVDESPEAIMRYRGIFPDANLLHGNTRDFLTHEWLKGRAPFDMLFIDAGHKYEDVKHDFLNYRDLVRKGGIIAFHDALKRPTYEEEIEVWRFLDDLRASGTHVHMIGTELGIAYIVKGESSV